MKTHSYRGRDVEVLASFLESAFDRIENEIHADMVMQATCPLCRGPLTARCDGGGPYFHCYCKESAPQDRQQKNSQTHPQIAAAEDQPRRGGEHALAACANGGHRLAKTQ